MSDEYFFDKSGFNWFLSNEPSPQGIPIEDIFFKNTIRVKKTFTNDFTKELSLNESHTYRAPISMHQEIRNKVISLMKQTIKTYANHTWILLKGGTQETEYASDNDVLFRQESYFSYLFGVKEPDLWGAINIGTSESYLFIPSYDDDYAIWSGPIPDTYYYKNIYLVEHVYYLSQISEIISPGGDSEPPKIYLLEVSTDKGTYYAPDLKKINLK